MKLEKIITLTGANAVRRLRFVAMERSLRNVGCDVPIWVIPFDQERFDLPKNSLWWEVDEISEWLKRDSKSPGFLKKYQALTTDHYQFADTDIVFLKNPAHMLESHSNFIVCCSHWRDWEHTCTPESAKWMKEKDSLWQRKAFNSGQFACEPALYDAKGLIDRASQPDILYTCLQSGPDQAGINALVFASEVPVTNLTLPPYCLESSWTGDYGSDYQKLWAVETKKPYLLHWAGIMMADFHPIDEEFYQYLSSQERKEFQEAYEKEVVRKFAKRRTSLRGIVRRVKKSLRTAIRSWNE